jgi:hypothetical protein
MDRDAGRTGCVVEWRREGLNVGRPSVYAVSVCTSGCGSGCATARLLLRVRAEFPYSWLAPALSHAGCTTAQAYPYKRVHWLACTRCLFAADTRRRATTRRRHFSQGAAMQRQTNSAWVGSGLPLVGSCQPVPGLCTKELVLGSCVDLDPKACAWTWLRMHALCEPSVGESLQLKLVGLATVVSPIAHVGPPCLQS